MPNESVWIAGQRTLAMTHAVLGAAEAPVGTTPKQTIWRKNKAALYRYTRSTANAPTQRTPIFLVLPLVPGSLPDLGSKMLNPLPSTVGAYVRLWDRLGEPDFDVRGWQAMYRWVNDGVPFPSAAYRQWIIDFYHGNKLAKGTLKVG